MKVEFQLSSNLVLQISESNYMSADQLIDQLMSHDGFTLKKDNVKRSVDNLLYNNHPIKKAYYDCLTGKVVLILHDYEWVDFYDQGITVLYYNESEISAYEEAGYVVENCERDRLKVAYDKLKNDKKYTYDILLGQSYGGENFFVMYKPDMGDDSDGNI